MTSAAPMVAQVVGKLPSAAEVEHPLSVHIVR